MTAVRIATTRGQDVQALGTAGQTAPDSWSALHSLLLRALSAEHAALLAEPVPNAARGEIDWYADIDGPAVPLPDLPEPERTAVRARLDRLGADIAALAARMRASRAEDERFLGEMLEFALQLPSEVYVRVADGRPIMVAWGHEQAGPAAERVTLGGYAARPTGAMPILPPPYLPVADALAGHRRGMLAALGAAALLLLLLLLFLFADPFGWSAVAAPDCRVAPGQLATADALREAAAREGTLRAQLAALAQAGGQRRLQCPPVAPPAAPVRPSDDERRAQEHGAQHGKMQVILAWDDRNDLDLSVVCPDGSTINFRRRAACSGHLDVDANGDVNKATDTPVENVYFDDPPPGHYHIVVDAYAMRQSVGPRSPFRLTIKQEGQPDRVLTGTATVGERNREVAAVDVPAS